MKNLLIATSVSEVRTAKDGRLFYVLGAKPAIGDKMVDPFAKETKRTIFQQFTAKSDPAKERNDINAQWVVGEPNTIKSLVASKVSFPGEAVTGNVEPYDLNGRQINTYSTLLFSRETMAVVFKNAGHPLLEEAPAQAEVIVEGAEPVID